MGRGTGKRKRGEGEKRGKEEKERRREIKTAKGFLKGALSDRHSVCVDVASVPFPQKPILLSRIQGACEALLVFPPGWAAFNT